MSKQSITMAIVVVVFVAIISGYIIYQNVTRDPVEESKDEISLLLEDIKNVTGLSFSDQKDVEFSWMVGQGDKIEEFVVSGQQTDVKNILDTNPIKDYFNSNEFEQDGYNLVNGAVAGITGYNKGNTVCLVVVKVCTKETSCFDKSDVSIKCGYLDDSTEPVSFGNISRQELTIGSKKDFSISLDADLATGYQWQVDFDYNFVQFIDLEYAPPSKGLSDGIERFDFKALKLGESSIVFSYLRPWEEKASIKKIIYNLIIE